MAEAQNRELQILAVYLKDCSVESPNAPAVFAEQGETQFNLNLDVKHTDVEGNRIEIVISISATAKRGDKTLLLIEAQQAGLFHVKGFEGDELTALLEIWGPAQVYPYAREVVASMASKAGFPQIVLPLVNFEQYHEQRKQAREGDGQPASQGNGTE